jgi:hypothetical protein
MAILWPKNVICLHIHIHKVCILKPCLEMLAQASDSAKIIKSANHVGIPLLDGSAMEGSIFRLGHGIPILEFDPHTRFRATIILLLLW